MISATCYWLGVLVAIAFVALAIVAPAAAATAVWFEVALVAAVLVYDRTGARRRD